MALSKYYLDLFTPFFEKKKCILAVSSVADSLGWVRVLRQLGIDKVFILAPSLGAGEVPLPEEAEWHLLESGARDALESFRWFGENLRFLPKNAEEALDRFDPEKTAIVLANTQFSIQEVAGRRTLFSRPSAWSDIEDKTKVGRIWESLNIPHTKSEVVPVVEERLRNATLRLRSSEGVVWSGDSKEGFNGAACYVRQVSNEQQFRDAFDFFSKHCNSVRMMPYLSGIPCSIHGIVFPDRVIVGRPVEQLVFLKPDSGTFHYAGVSTSWDPDPPSAESMRRAARAVGDYLRKTVAYGGAFSLDGILTDDGFFPTEINTRFSMGIIVQTSGIPEIPFGLIDYFLRVGSPLDFRAEDLEQKLQKSAEENRKVVGWSLTQRRMTSNQVLYFRRDGSSFEKVECAEDAEAVVTVGPSDVGGMVKISLLGECMRRRTVAGPLICSLLRFLDSTIGTDFGRIVLPYSYPIGGSGADAMLVRRLVS